MRQLSSLQTFFSLRLNRNLHTRSATVKHNNPENSQTLTKNSQKHPKKIPENHQIPNIQHTVANDLPKQVRNEANELKSATKGKNKRKMHVPSGNLKKKGCCCKHENHRQKGSRASLRKSKGEHRRKKKQKKLSEKTQ